MNRLAVINVVGLSERLISRHTPRIAAFRQRGSFARINPAFPAVTCVAQTNYLTGKTPAAHGIVGNGWYARDLAEVQFWKQSNHLVQAPKIWDALRNRSPTLTVANCFWWYNMFSRVDYAITPRPIYRADGGKIFDVYSWPYSIRPELKQAQGEFPFFGFWGPTAGIKTPRGGADCASQWIAECARWIETRYLPALNLVYLPHLDYNLQRHGVVRGTAAGAPTNGPTLNPAIAPDLQAVDAIVGDLIEFFEARSMHILLLSEYGITDVDQPVHLNRIFRERGWLAVKDELGTEVMDAGASRVFAVADHQVAHIYINDLSLTAEVRNCLAQTAGVEQILGEAEKSIAGIDHARAGDLIAVAAERAWFTYYYWLDDARAPDFARTVDIHRKPGYDPVELFLDPNLAAPQLKVAWRLLQKKLGFRMLMDVIPLDATLIKGSHGRRPADQNDWPVLISNLPGVLDGNVLDSTDVFQVIQRYFD